jgi:hypothetical protein
VESTTGMSTIAIRSAVRVERLMTPKRSKRKCVVKTAAACSPSSSNGSVAQSTAAEAVTQSTSGEKSLPSEPKRVVRFWRPGGDWTDHKLPFDSDGNTYSIGVVETMHNRMTSNSLAASFETRDERLAIVKLHQMGRFGWNTIQTIDMQELLTLRKLGGD